MKRILGKMSKKKIILLLIIAIVAVVTAVMVFSGDSEDEITIGEHHTMTRGDIEVTIQASGVVRPTERREITALVGGTVVHSPFREGDSVSAGDVLYRIDDTDARLTVEQRQTAVSRAAINAQQTNQSVGQLTVTAPASGILTGFDVNIGDQVGGMGGAQIATIVDNDNLTVRVPFHASDAESIRVGDSVAVTSAQFMTTMDGRVTHVLNSSVYGGLMRDIEISLINPGALELDMSVGATVHTSNGNVMSSGSGQLSAGTTAAVIPEQGGRVEQVYVRNGEFVTRGQRLVQLSNTDLTNRRDTDNLNMRESDLQLESQLRRLDDYTITSPIDGVVISKSRDVGDNVSAGAGMREVLMVVADMREMVFDIDVDEMEIARVQLGQSVIVTADALPGQEFEGEVTNVAAEGVAANGVTKFAVEITIAEPGDLMPGMNADANIVVERAENVLMLPVNAVMGGGEMGMVFLRGASGITAPDGTEIDTPQAVETPEGYGMRQVRTGVRNTRFVEIIEGLGENDIVGIRAMPAMGGMFPGGMMPGGGMMMGPGMSGGGNMQVRPAGGGGGGQMVFRTQ
ncbi:MAG: efflux RND transporter periplasmic adaptor subunit [Oscillospiraceae bacterium]|nr:efflux RND transporter periplasmic adaptor subunit [Oscillospiraceae bacterium]